MPTNRIKVNGEGGEAPNRQLQRTWGRPKVLIFFGGWFGKGDDDDDDDALTTVPLSSKEPLKMVFGRHQVEIVEEEPEPEDGGAD